MHDIRVLREQMDVLRAALRRRGALDGLASMLERAETLERDRRTLIQAVEERKAARNASSQEVAQRKRNKQPADDLIARGKELGEEIAKLEQELSVPEQSLQRILHETRTRPLPDVRAGGKEKSRSVKEWENPGKAAGLKPHWEIGATLGIIDV